MLSIYHSPLHIDSVDRYDMQDTGATQVDKKGEHVAREPTGVAGRDSTLFQSATAGRLQCVKRDMPHLWLRGRAEAIFSPMLSVFVSTGIWPWRLDRVVLSGHSFWFSVCSLDATIPCPQARRSLHRSSSSSRLID